jgi:hypothetical protein
VVALAVLSPTAQTVALVALSPPMPSQSCLAVPHPSWAPQTRSSSSAMPWPYLAAPCPPWVPRARPLYLLTHGHHHYRLPLSWHRGCPSVAPVRSRRDASRFLVCRPEGDALLGHDPQGSVASAHAMKDTVNNLRQKLLRVKERRNS